MKFKLDNLVEELKKVELEMSDPSIFSDKKRLKEVWLRKKELALPVKLYLEYKTLNQDLQDNKEMLAWEKDEEMKDMLKEEIKQVESRILELEEELQIALLPRDPNDDKNIILEIRAWTGWDEAWLFAYELANAYKIFAKEDGYKLEVINESLADWAWLKEWSYKIIWEWAYSRFKFEAGVHRVQRIPKTESKWRVHTSAVTVAVLPEAEDIDIIINDEDLDIKACRSSWAWGQSVNKTNSAIRIEHIPTWLVVECQDERSQLKNKNKAITVLKARLYAKAEEERMLAEWGERAAQIGSWDRSEKIRTYNFPQDRVTDHRIGQNFSNLPWIMMWKMWAIFDAVAAADQIKKLEEASN